MEVMFPVTPSYKRENCHNESDLERKERKWKKKKQVRHQELRERSLLSYSKTQSHDVRKTYPYAARDYEMTAKNR